MPPPSTGNNSGNDSGNTIGNIVHLLAPHPLPTHQHRSPIQNQNTGKNGKQKSGNGTGNDSGNTSGNACRLPPAPNFSRPGQPRSPTSNNSGNTIGKAGNAIHPLARTYATTHLMRTPEKIGTRANHSTIATAPATHPAKNRQQNRQQRDHPPQRLPASPQSTKVDFVARSAQLPAGHRPRFQPPAVPRALPRPLK